jgi:2,3-bisphosphoglycerate-independent phosphoglycerate mutase
MHVLFLFLDGVGIGKKDAAANPFFAARIPVLENLLGGTLLSLHHRTLESDEATALSLDATLGVEGLPQSGTGQAALFTGVNAPLLIGKHFGPHPYSTLRPVIEAHNIFRRVLQAGLRPCFANAYPQKFFDYVEARQSRLTVTTLSCKYAGMPLRREEDLRGGYGVSADITREGWLKLGHSSIPVISPRVAGTHLGGLCVEHEFVLFEYWKTDHAGHGQSLLEAVDALERFDGLLGGLLATIDRRHTLVVLTSDHGNLEDLTIKTHTRNPVPLILTGRGHRAVAARVCHYGGRAPNLTHVLPALMEVLQDDGGIGGDS